MAKFFITNNKLWYESTKKRIEESEFSKSFDFTDDCVFALAVHKRNFRNENAVKQENNKSFVIATGTAIFDEGLKYQKVIQDFNGDINAIRKRTIGQYAYSILKDGKITIFGDRFGVYDIFYFSDGKNFYASNFLYDMAAVLRNEISINEMNVIEFSATTALLCDETFFNEIYRLNGDSKIEITNGRFSVISNPTDSEWKLKKDEDYDKVIDTLVNHLKYKAGVVSKVLGNPTISLTGGLDSRTSLAAYLSVGAKPHIRYGRSNTMLASPVKDDEYIILDLAEKHNLDIKIMSWDTTSPEKTWDKYLQRYGFLYRMWGAADPIMKYYESDETNLITFGWGGELYRNVTLTDHLDHNVKYNDIFTFYSGFGYGEQERLYTELPEFKDHIANKLHKILKRHNIDEDNITPEDVFYLCAEYEKTENTSPLNEINLTRYCNLLLYEADCVECVRVNTKRMDGARLMLDVMNRLMPSVLDTPICTRCLVHKFDRKNLRLMDVHDTKRSKFELKLKSLYRSSKFLLEPFRLVYKAIENKVRPVKDTIVFTAPHVIVENKWDGVLKNKIQIKDNRINLYYMMNLKALKSLGF